jgi:hypothetical protein
MRARFELLAAQTFLSFSANRFSIAALAFQSLASWSSCHIAFVSVVGVRSSHCASNALTAPLSYQIAAPVIWSLFV